MRRRERDVEERHRHADQIPRIEHPRMRPEEEESRGEPRTLYPDQQSALAPAVAPDLDCAMAIDLLDREEELVLTAAVPGFSPDEIAVRLVDDVVQIEATHEEEEKEGRYIAQERRRSMSRSVALGTPIAEDEEIAAHYENGEVTIRLPKAEPVEETSVRQIDIE